MVQLLFWLLIRLRVFGTSILLYDWSTPIVQHRTQLLRFSNGLCVLLFEFSLHETSRDLNSGFKFDLSTIELTKDLIFFQLHAAGVEPLAVWRGDLDQPVRQYCKQSRLRTDRRTWIDCRIKLWPRIRSFRDRDQKCCSGTTSRSILGLLHTIYTCFQVFVFLHHFFIGCLGCKKMCFHVFTFLHHFANKVSNEKWCENSKTHSKKCSVQWALMPSHTFWDFMISPLSH